MESTIENATSMVDRAWQSSVSEFDAIFRDSNLQFGEDSTTRLNFDKEFGKNQKSYENYFQLNRNQSFFVPFNQIDRSLKIIADSFNFIEMSRRRAEDHKNSYVIGTEDVALDLDLQSTVDASVSPIEINISPNMVEKVYELWRDKAMQLVEYALLWSRNETQRIDKLEASNQSVFYVVGNPGVGKTAFINYLFSVKAEQLIDRKVLYLRVSLTGANAGSTSSDLEVLFHSKFIRIFSKFYLYAMPEFNSQFLQDFKDYLLKNEIGDSRAANEDKFNLLVNHFAIYEEMLQAHSTAAQEDLDKLVDMTYGKKLSLKESGKITEHLIAFIQQTRKYGYIVIFDGLDNVTIDYIQSDNFAKWCEAIHPLTLIESHPYKALYIVVMRDYSYVEKILMRHASHHRSIDLKYPVFEIKAQPLKEILERKYKLVLKILRADTQLPDEHSKVVARLETDDIKRLGHKLLQLIFTQIHELVDLPSPTTADDVGEEYYDRFMAIANYNFRSVMRLIRELIVMVFSIKRSRAFDLLTDETKPADFPKLFEGKHWIVHRLLLFGRCNHEVYRNRVTYHLAGNRVGRDERSPKIEAEIIPDHRAVVPNIFNYADVVSDNQLLYPLNLVKIRIIQEFCDPNVAGSTLSSESRGVVALLQKVNRLYQYIPESGAHDPIAVLRYELREMIINGMLNPVIDNEKAIMVHDELGGDYPVTVSGLTGTMWKRLLRQEVYYETVMDDTPLPSRLAQKLQLRPLNRYERGLDLDDFLVRKTRYVMLFIKFLIQLEYNDQKKYDSENGANSYNRHGRQIFSEKVIKGILSDMERYLASYLKTLKKENRKAFETLWKTTFALSSRM
jgi:hypothetical protein